MISPIASATSLGVEPLLLEISPSQSAAIRVRNSADKDMPVEVFVYRRDVNEDGIQVRIPADDDFIIFPPQSAIKAGGRQVFRIRPVTAQPRQSSSYYVSFNQVPEEIENFEGSGATVQVVFSFDAAVHVVPRKAEGNAEIKTADLSTIDIKRETGEITPQPDGSQVPVVETVTVPSVEIDFLNSGNKFLYLHQQRFKAILTDENGKTRDHIWTADEISKAAKVTLVEPAEARKLHLPLPDDVKAKTVEVTVRPNSSGL
jgi:fimbrial chaperone protein